MLGLLGYWTNAPRSLHLLGADSPQRRIWWFADELAIRSVFLMKQQLLKAQIVSRQAAQTGSPSPSKAQMSGPASRRARSNSLTEPVRRSGSDPLLARCYGGLRQ